MFSFDRYLPWNMDRVLLYVVELLVQFEVARHGGGKVLGSVIAAEGQNECWAMLTLLLFSAST